MIILIIIFLFILTFPFYIFKKKYKNSAIVQKDIYFLDKNVVKHPLIREREFIKVTSLSSNFVDVDVDKKIYITDVFKVLHESSIYSIKDILNGLGIILKLFLNSPICTIPIYIKSLKSFFLISIEILNKNFYPERIVCVMTRPDFGVSLFCEINKIESVFIYLSSTELTVPKRYLAKDYITCLDYAFMTSDIIICDIVSKNWLFSQKMRVLILKPWTLSLNIMLIREGKI